MRIPKRVKRFLAYTMKRKGDRHALRWIRANQQATAVYIYATQRGA